jgi:hypothetical protein
MWMFNCKDVSRLVSESMDRRLTWRQRYGIRFHLLMCRYCSRYQKQMRLLRRLLRQQAETPQDSSLPALDEAGKDRLRKLIDQDHSSQKDQ